MTTNVMNFWGLYVEKQTPPFPHLVVEVGQSENFEVDDLWQLVVFVTDSNYWLGVLSSEALASMAAL
jgi:hypothetical protein